MSVDSFKLYLKLTVCDIGVVTLTLGLLKVFLEVQKYLFITRRQPKDVQLFLLIFYYLG